MWKWNSILVETPEEKITGFVLGLQMIFKRLGPSLFAVTNSKKKCIGTTPPYVATAN